MAPSWTTWPSTLRKPTVASRIYVQDLAVWPAPALWNLQKHLQCRLEGDRKPAIHADGHSAKSFFDGAPTAMVGSMMSGASRPSRRSSSRPRSVSMALMWPSAHREKVSESVSSPSRMCRIRNEIEEWPCSIARAARAIPLGPSAKHSVFVWEIHLAAPRSMTFSSPPVGPSTWGVSPRAAMSSTQVRSSAPCDYHLPAPLCRRRRLAAVRLAWYGNHLQDWIDSATSNGRSSASRQKIVSLARYELPVTSENAGTLALPGRLRRRERRAPAGQSDREAPRLHGRRPDCYLWGYRPILEPGLMPLNPPLRRTHPLAPPSPSCLRTAGMLARQGVPFRGFQGGMECGRGRPGELPGRRRPSSPA